MRPFLVLFGLLGLWPVVGCDDDGGKRPVGAVCAASGQCESGICGGGTCLDPAGDADSDGLINQIEAALGTNPVESDSDGDGTADLAEVGSVDSPVDSDGDGKIDDWLLVFGAGYGYHAWDDDYDGKPDRQGPTAVRAF